MTTYNLKTYSPKLADLKPAWHVIDADDEVLGRLASRVAQLLMGKHNPRYAPHLNSGDAVIVINAEKIRVSGAKLQQKQYYRHSGYPGGLKSEKLEVTRAKHPARVIEHAVKGMLPHNALGRAMLGRLHVYAGPNHPHQAQVAGQAKSQA